MRWVKAFWEIVRKASSVNKSARAEGTVGSRHRRVSFLHGFQPFPAACANTRARVSVVKEGRKR